MYMKIFSAGPSLWSGSTITIMVCCGIRSLRDRRSIAYVTDALNLLYTPISIKVAPVKHGQ